MQTVLGHDAAVAEWVTGNLKIRIFPPLTAIGWVDGTGTLVSGAVFHDWNGSNIETTIFGRLTRQTVKELMRYVFVQLGANRLTARTKRSNKRMQKICLKMGFLHEAVQPRFFGSHKRDDAVVFRMMREHAERWLK